MEKTMVDFISVASSIYHCFSFLNLPLVGMSLKWNHSRCGLLCLAPLPFLNMHLLVDVFFCGPDTAQSMVRTAHLDCPCTENFRHAVSQLVKPGA